MKPSLSSSKQPSKSTSYKEVRFSQATPRRAQSVATSNPLLDPGYTATHAATRTPEVSSYYEFAAYIEHSHSLLERQRANFERERAAFAEERKLWDMERALLKSRIAELESRKDNSNGTSKPAHFRTDFTFNSSQRNGWSNSNGQNGHHVWEGSSPGSVRPTRVFPDENKKSDLHISPVEENGFGLPPSLDAALSPQSRPVDRSESSVPVPIEKVDSELDGITLKSTALPAEVAAKAMTPPANSPPKSTSEGRTPMKLKLSDLGPPDENLTRDAGHTPMAILGTETEASYQSPTEDIAEEEKPLAPATTKQQPVENSDSYFPVDLEDDPALKGPLSLQNDAKADSSFLSELDQKLLDEAKKAAGPAAAKADGHDDDDDDDDEPDPELKLKNSTNFGTAFGVSQCGNV
ncbi:hypothetical protein VTN77DRAFT_2898 [Rasamsonia byssochlamydoides]|uniref:uncharacterized protein n=1 Tax=Rasamsonia byssochlamydoides TaxID=89139 RepID=UPI003741FD72